MCLCSCQDFIGSSNKHRRFTVNFWLTLFYVFTLRTSVLMMPLLWSHSHSIINIQISLVVNLICWQLILPYFSLCVVALTVWVTHWGAGWQVGWERPHPDWWQQPPPRRSARQAADPSARWTAPLRPLFGLSGSPAPSCCPDTRPEHGGSMLESSIKTSIYPAHPVTRRGPLL